jgi:hypothetical protein
VLRRPRLNPPDIGETVIWSASEHLVIERPLAPAPRRQLRHRIAPIVIFLGCAAVIGYLLAKPPASVPAPPGSAATPAQWFHRYAFDKHQRLRLLSLAEHGGVAVLRITLDSGGTQAVTLRERSGQWQPRVSP